MSKYRIDGEVREGDYATLVGLDVNKTRDRPAFIKLSQLSDTGVSGYPVWIRVDSIEAVTTLDHGDIPGTFVCMTGGREFVVNESADDITDRMMIDDWEVPGYEKKYWYRGPNRYRELLRFAIRLGFTELKEEFKDPSWFKESEDEAIKYLRDKGWNVICPKEDDDEDVPF